MAGPKILYTTLDSVKVRLIQKVQFQQDPTVIEQGEMPDVLLNQLICDAETDVEQELRNRYAIPFRSITNHTYDGLPDHTRRAIRTVVDLKAVMNVLETDFGDGGHTDSEAYVRSTKRRYDMGIKRLLGLDAESADQNIKRYRHSPPLEDLMLAKTNLADDGLRGQLSNGGDGRPSVADYASAQVNDPSLVNFWGRGRNPYGGSY